MECPSCLGTGDCPECEGDGCGWCEYTGVCPDCGGDGCGNMPWIENEDDEEGEE